MYILDNLTSDGLNGNILSFYYVITTLFAFYVIEKKNSIVSVLFLIGLFFNVSLYLACIGATYLALSYLLVYVGAVSILFLFILMLINIRISELSVNTNNSLILVFITASFFIISLGSLLPLEQNNYLMYFFTRDYNSFDSLIYYLTSYSLEVNCIPVTIISSIGNIMYTSSAIYLILTGFILLLAMVGTILITLKTSKIS